MALQGLGFAFIAVVGLATAIYYFLNQAGPEYAHSNSRNNEKPPSFDHGPDTNSWHEGGRDTSGNTKRKRKLSMQREEAVCAICREELSNTKQLQCKHRFHSNCINKWFKEKGSPSCPLCRASDQ